MLTPTKENFMQKYIILVLSVCSPLYCMKSLIDKESPDYFKNLIVLSYDGCEDHAIHIAKTAKLVHSNTMSCYNPKKYPHIENLFFRQPQHNIYDLVTVYNPHMLNKKNILTHLKTIYNCLAPSGTFCCFMRTQTNNISVPEQAFATVYSQTHSSAQYFTDDKLKEIIWSNGYEILSYTNETYETVIDNTYDYQETIKEAFAHNIRHHNLPEPTIQQRTEQLIELVIQQSKKNNLNQLIESWNFTKIILSKADQPRPSLFINNSLLSTEWTQKSHKK
jgi:hypothetical protein